jgi:large subunit ribosomal protein L23
MNKLPKKGFIIEYPHLSEKSISQIDRNNTLVFIVDKRATKDMVKKEVEKTFNVKVEKINVLIDRKGRKKAFVKLNKEYNAMDIATRLGMM